MPRKVAGISIVLDNGAQTFTPDQFNKRVKEYVTSAIFDPQVWRNFGASLSRFMREESEDLQGEWVNNIVSRYWQNQKGGGVAFGLAALSNPETENSGKRLIELISELETRVTRNTDAAGISINIALDLTPVVEGTMRKAFPYVYAQEFGNQLFDGKHFILDEDGESLHPADEVIFKKLVDRVRTRIQASIGRGRRR